MLSGDDPLNRAAERLARFSASADFAGDGSANALMPDERALLGELWWQRAKNELRTSRVFAQLQPELALLPAPPAVLELCETAIDDEAFHAELCARLAEHYGRPARPLLPSVEPPPPSFALCSSRVHRALFAALHCCVNETIAVTYLSACLAEAQSGVVRAALREILKDEVRHSRIGWAVLASPELSAGDRGTISRFMPALLDACVGVWLADTDAESSAPPPLGHGCLARPAIAQAAAAAIADVILPGLEHLRIDAAPARRWSTEKKLLTDATTL